METNIAVIEWSPDFTRAYNPVTRQTATGATVEDALRRVGSPPVVGLCLGRRFSFVRETRAPNADKSDLRLIVTLQLETLFPAMKTELAFDFEKGTNVHEDGIQTIVAAAQADSLRRALKDVETAGAKVAWTAPVAMGSERVARAQGHDDAIVVEQVGAALSLDVVRHGHVVYTRGVVDPESVEGRIEEVERTLAGYGLPTAAIIAVEGTDLGRDARVCQEGPLQAMAEYSATALNIELPEVVARKVRRQSQAKTRVAMFLWLAVLLAGGWVWAERSDAARNAASTTGKDQMDRAGLQDKIAQVDERLGAAEANRGHLVQAFAPSQPVSDVLKLFVNSVPDNAWLTGITFERGKPVLVRGTAVVPDAVTNYTTSLALENRLRDVQLLFANNAEIEATPVVQFSISAHAIGNLPLVDLKKKGGSR
ncbi:MAG: PilN domain-containing protein [Fimbriimonadaceae bacterium]